MEIRPVTPEDASGICRIYNHYILHSTAVFHTEPVEDTFFATAIQTALDSGKPFFTASEDGQIVGFCYIHTWNTKCAFAATQELTIYLDPGYTGSGRGSRLMEHLLAAVDRSTVHVLLAGITLPNDPSVRLHEKFGFRQVSYFKEVGFKFDRWQDLGHWQLIL